MADQPAVPKIQIDSDWKAEAQKEKERLTAKVESEKAARGEHGREGAGPGTGAGADPNAPLPPADFRALVGMLAQQAVMGLGVLSDRKTGGIIIDLEGSRYAIDLLDILEQKTRGNLQDDEKKELTQILADLRARFVQVANMMAKQMREMPATAGEMPPTSGSHTPAATRAASPIITE